MKLTCNEKNENYDKIIKIIKEYENEEISGEYNNEYITFFKNNNVIGIFDIRNDVTSQKKHIENIIENANDMLKIVAFIEKKINE